MAIAPFTESEPTSSSGRGADLFAARLNLLVAAVNALESGVTLDPAALAAQLVDEDALIDAFATSASLPYFVPTGSSASAIQAVINATPAGNIVDIRDNKVIGGGGRVLLEPNGTYTLTSSLQLPPGTTLVMNGATLDYTGSSSAITRKGTSPYDGNAIAIEGPGYITSSTGTGQSGIDFTRVTAGSITGPLIIWGFASHGIDLKQCQWMNIQGVECSNNGGYGVHLGDSTDDGYRTNNCTFTRCKFEENTTGGAFLEEAHQNAFFGCTFQFSGASAPGLHVKGGDAFANSAVACHFEGNQYHVLVEATSPSSPSGMPRGTSIVAPFFVIDSNVDRFVYNQGTATSVLGGGTTNDGASMPSTATPTTPFTASTAPFMQHTVAGTMDVLGFPAISGITNLWVSDTGTETGFTGGGYMSSGKVILPNQTPFYALNTARVARAILSMNSSNIVLVGHASHNLRFDHSALGFFSATPVGQKTGWGAATGTATRTTFATSTVTTTQLAEHVKALIDDLIAYGLLAP